MAWATLEVCGGKERTRRVQWLECAAYEPMEAGPEPHAKGLEDHTKPNREPLKLIRLGVASTLHAPGTDDQVGPWAWPLCRLAKDGLERAS